MWEFYQQLLAECDRQIEAVLHELAGPEPEPPADAPTPPQPSVAVKPSGKNAPQIEPLHQLLVRICGGRDATALPGIADYLLLQLISETGVDLSAWPTEKQFISWLGLPPGSRQSGKRRGNTARQRNRAGRLFCVMARSVGRSVDKALGGFYRRLKGRRGGWVANQALALADRPQRARQASLERRPWCGNRAGCPRKNRGAAASEV